MNPVAFSLFQIDVYWYGIILTSCFLIALFLSKKANGKFGITYENVLDFFIISIPVIWMGARIYYIVFSEGTDLTIKEIFQFKKGGLAIYGGILGGVISGIVFCRIKKINVLDFFDFLVPYLAIGQSIGRWANYINQEAYGYETNLPWRIKIVEEGMIKYVHPTFLYESIGTFCLFLFLIKMSKNRKFRGYITYFYIVGYSLIRFLIEGLRTDSLMWQRQRISQVLSGILFVIFCSIFIYKIIKERNTRQEKKKTQKMADEK